MATRPDELATLEPDWDSYGALAITPEAIRTANNLCFVPLCDGGIQIELYAGGMEIEIEIGPDGRVDPDIIAEQV